MSFPNSLWRTFLNGLVVVLPVVLTIAALYWFGASLEHFLGAFLRLFLPAEHYFTGLGLIAGVALVFLVGLALRIWLIRRILRLGEALLERVPLAKSVYSGVRDLMGFVSDASDPDQMRKVVLVTLGGGVRLIGFVTRDDAEIAGDAVPDDHVTVYLQMSYQLGGYTVFVPRDRVTPLDMDMEQAMRWVLTAGMSRQDESEESDD
jgi:uncharacterized membrane protein